jgi:hypothetical protein
MKNKKLLLIIFLLISNIAFSQNNRNTLFYKKGEVFDSRMNKLNEGQIKFFIKDYSKAFSYYNKAKTNKIFKQSFLYGSFLPLSFATSLYYNDEFEYEEHGTLVWGCLGVGCALLGGSLILNSRRKTNLNKAINNYNDAINSENKSDGLAINVGFTSNGFGLLVKF